MGKGGDDLSMAVMEMSQLLQGIGTVARSCGITPFFQG